MKNARLDPSREYATHRAHLAMMFQWTMAALAVAAGLLSLIHDTWTRQSLDGWVNIHVVFGLLLVGFVVSRLDWCCQRQPVELAGEIREISRQVSRLVYLVLYLVVGLRELVAIAHAIRTGGTFDFNVFDERLRSGPDTIGLDPKDDFHWFIACGLVALVVVRTWTYRVWLRLSKDTVSEGTAT